MSRKTGKNFGGILLAGAGRGGLHKDRQDRDHKRNRKNFRRDLKRGRFE
jgi:hypothetical protein